MLSRPLALAARARPAVRRTAALSVRRYSEQRIQKPLPMPPDMPREDYAGAAAYTVGFLGRTIKYVVLGSLGLGVAAVLAFEGMHMYVEHVCLAPPSRADDGDEYAWADENQAWTGGAKGGTDPRLGWRGRHALRGAWICWEWGAGDTAGAISKANHHPSLHGVGVGMIGGANRVDRGYALAEEYIDAAIAQAKARGLAFPPELSAARSTGPAGLTTSNVPVDPTTTDLLALKAGVLERIGGHDALVHARELYERILAATSGDSTVATARAMRLAHKLGDLAQRSGDAADAQEWWAWGLSRAGLRLPSPASTTAFPSSSKKSSWVPWGSSGSSSSTTPSTSPEFTGENLPPVVLRAATSILISASAADAARGALSAAAATQKLALSVLPPSARLSPPGPGEAPAALQRIWEEQRGTLLTLHAASVAHAQGLKDPSPLSEATRAAEQSEAVLSSLTPSIPSAFTLPRANPCAQPAKRLLRDALLTGAESYYTQATLLERSADGLKHDADGKDRMHRLEHAGECFERAMSLSAAEEGQTQAKSFGDEDAVGRGEEWMRYWRGYVRVREKLLAALERTREVK